MVNTTQTQIEAENDKIVFAVIDALKILNDKAQSKNTVKSAHAKVGIEYIHKLTSQMMEARFN